MVKQDEVPNVMQALKLMLYEILRILIEDFGPL